MVILRLLAIASLTIVHIEVAQLNDVAGGRPLHEKVGKHLSNFMAARDKVFLIGSTSNIKEVVYQKSHNFTLALASLAASASAAMAR